MKEHQLVNIILREYCKPKLMVFFFLNCTFLVGICIAKLQKVSFKCFEDNFTSIFFSSTMLFLKWVHIKTNTIIGVSLYFIT